MGGSEEDGMLDHETVSNKEKSATPQRITRKKLTTLFEKNKAVITSHGVGEVIARSYGLPADLPASMERGIERLARFKKAKCLFTKERHRTVGLISVIIVLIAALIIVGTRPTSCDRNKEVGEHRTITPAAEITDIKIEKSAPCEDYWIWYRGKCYYFSTERDTWRNSEKFCISHNSSLAIIESKEELDFLLRFRGSENQWIGIKHTYAGTGWIWTNGRSYDESLFKITRLSEHSGTDEYAFLNQLDM
ncbi:C-type lectin domain family 7 member A-like isoform X2 [Dendrobates tinctorius]|uniref:C-type lectin domain family 7 member A-like isoform X2 n=1 Tax=Dendrobates tinctorius TaxID=92724 RepID=UPI003CCA0E20